jgi:hypothetical protein
MAVRVVALDRPDLPPLAMPERFRHEVTYFMSFPGAGEGPVLSAGEYWIRPEDARQWLEEGVFRLVSPLDSANRTEVELSEEQEEWLEWMVQGGVQHIRLD